MSADQPDRLPLSSGAIRANSRRTFLTLFPSIMLPMFLAVVDQTIVATALPAIGGSLGDIERLPWVVVSYLVANTIAAPIYGTLGDALGRRRVMLSALVIFMAASFLCAIAPNLLALVAARVLQGLGGGGLMTTSQSLIGEAIPPRERPRYQGYLAAVVVTSAAFGPVVGGLLTQAFGWRSVFAINIPLGLLAFFLTRRLPPMPRRTEAWHLDIGGIVFFAAFVVPVLLALEQVQKLDPRSLPMLVALLALAAVSLWLLLRQERRESSPLLPLALLRQPTIWRCNALTLCHGATLTSLVAFSPLYFRAALGTPPASSGLLLMPVGAGIGIGSILTSRLVTKTGRTTLFPVCGQAAASCLLLILVWRLDSLSPWQTTAMLGLVSFFLGSTMNVVQVMVANAAGTKLLGAAAGSVQFSRSVGGAFGAAAFGATLFIVVKLLYPDVADLFGALIEKGPEVLAGLPAPRQATISAAMIDAFRSAYLLLAGFSATASIVAATIPMRRL